MTTEARTDATARNRAIDSLLTIARIDDVIDAEVYGAALDYGTTIDLSQVGDASSVAWAAQELVESATAYRREPVSQTRLALIASAARYAKAYKADRAAPAALNRSDAFFITKMALD